MERSRLWLKKLSFAVFAISFLATFSHAQSTPAADVAVGYSPLYILKGYTIWMNGGSGSVAVNANHWFGVAGDFGACLGHIPQSLTGETYMVGPRFSYRKLDRLVPFAQTLFGGSHFSESSGGITGGGTQFTFALVGGVDLGLSRRKFAVRLEGDYFGIRSSGSTTGSARLSAGIVYRIGKKWRPIRSIFPLFAWITSRASVKAHESECAKNPTNLRVRWCCAARYLRRRSILRFGSPSPRFLTPVCGISAAPREPTV